jgi:hypothetical protein
VTTLRKSLSALMVAALLLTCAIDALATDEFDTVVRLVESNYRVRRRRVPFLANMAMRRAVRAGGVRGFKLAVFEDQDFSERALDADFSSGLRGGLRPEWQPLLRTSSQEGTRAFIYTSAAGENFKLLLINIELRQAVVVQIEVTPQALVNWLRNPDELRRALIEEATSEIPE